MCISIMFVVFDVRTLAQSNLKHVNDKSRNIRKYFVVVVTFILVTFAPLFSIHLCLCCVQTQLSLSARCG